LQMVARLLECVSLINNNGAISAVKIVTRIDNLTELRIDETSEGYLSGTAVIARTGVQEYRNADGSIRREYRPPEEVSKKIYLDSIKMIPVTNGHPNEPVTAQNASSLSIGTTGERVDFADGLVTSSLRITHKDGIEAVKSGRKELSLGYQVTLEHKPGVTEDGEEYDYIQTQMVANHLAIVDRARAGSIARLNVDGDCVLQDNTNNSLQEDNKGKHTMVTINIDGFPREVAPEAAKHIEALESKLAEAKSGLAKLEARADAAEEELTKVKAVNSDEKIQEAVAKKLDLLSKATKFDGVEVEGLGSKSDREIMASCLKVARPSLALDSKSDEYISAAFDLALDSMGEDKAKKVAKKVGAQMKKDGADAPAHRSQPGMGRREEILKWSKK
jgi:hypothetical protein